MNLFAGMCKEPLIQNFIIESNKATSAHKLIALWHQAMRSLGFDRLLFTLLMDHNTIERKAGHVAVLNYPPAWLAQYSANHYEDIDPVRHHMFVTKGAFTWDSLKSLRKLTQIQTALLNTAIHAGLNNGVCIPMRGPSGELAGVMAACSMARPQWDVVTLDNSGLLSEQFYKVYLQLGQKAEIIETIKLTDRERQVLSLCAVGRTQLEIAKNLGVTAHAVNFHMRGIYSKLDTCNPETAMLKAMAMGLIPSRHTFMLNKGSNSGL